MTCNHDIIVGTLYSNRVTTETIKESTPLPPLLHSRLGCLLFSLDSTTLHEGDGGGKALFSPLEVSKVSESPFRAKCLNCIILSRIVALIQYLLFGILPVFWTPRSLLCKLLVLLKASEPMFIMYMYRKAREYI